MLKKTNQELLIEDNGEGAKQYQELWGLLADKEYQGAGSMLRCIYPKKKPKNGELTADELVRNGNVSSDCVLVEIVFGRVCMLWKISHSTFKWNESTFDSFIKTCFALTNFDVEVNPLRADDGCSYKSVMKRYEAIAEREAHAVRRLSAAIGASVTLTPSHNIDDVDFNLCHYGFPWALVAIYLLLEPSMFIKTPLWLLIKGHTEKAIDVIASMYGEEHAQTALAWLEISTASAPSSLAPALWNSDVWHHGTVVAITSDARALVGVDVVRLTDRPGRQMSVGEFFPVFAAHIHPIEWGYIRGAAPTEDEEGQYANTLG
ncbi:unnamed protein product [Phytophthora lilii]|uniref:Unnamed protein product n=1 Tax=Phytophthora lilii TaxID=2077276 RepID=A0A9W6TW95_9STRA|nr:unnamed protein product [Phytophthora lilii]